jgi:hypothetical protein
MNERIQELAVQADNYAYKMNPEEDSYGRAANPRKFQQDRDTKFAELIVKDITAGQRELAKTLSDTGSEDQAYILRITAGNIERKFGVEE